MSLCVWRFVKNELEENIKGKKISVAIKTCKEDVLNNEIIELFFNSSLYNWYVVCESISNTNRENYWKSFPECFYSLMRESIIHSFILLSIQLSISHSWRILINLSSNNLDYTAMTIFQNINKLNFFFSNLLHFTAICIDPVHLIHICYSSANWSFKLDTT